MAGMALLATIAAASAASRRAPDPFTCTFDDGHLSVDTTTGGYTVTVGAESGANRVDTEDAPLPPLVGGAGGVLRGGRWLSPGSGLTLRSHATAAGADGIGEFQALSLSWGLSSQNDTSPHATPGTAWEWMQTFRCYTSGPLTFTQSFPSGSTDAPGPPRNTDTPGTAFPSFSTAAWPSDLQLATFYAQNAAQTTAHGPFNATFPKKTGYLGGPLALFRPTLAAVAVLSPLSAFMVTEHGWDPASGEVRFGLQGMLHTVPPGFEASFVLSAFVPDAPNRPAADRIAHAGVVAAAFSRWGDALLAAHGGSRSPPDASPWISQLGYSSTGVFHYNPCDCPGNTNRSACPKGNNPLMPGCTTYEDTVLQVQAYARRVGLPYRWWLIDSWWHAFDENRFFEDTPAQVGQLFPRGLKWLRNATGLTFGAHWSSTFNVTSPYVNMTGADQWACQGESCIPRSAAVWQHIFGANAAWGMRTIKVDHLYEALADVPEVLTDPFLAHAFLGGMADAAAEHSVDIMWCMSYPNVLMQSVMYPAATHARGSSDSHPSDNNFVGFGGESTFEWALGLWPFKDTFYSNSSEASLNSNGQDYGHREKLPFTHALAASLSGGGVAPGGVIGGADVELIMMTCRADGTLLKPTTPAMYIDAVWLGERSVGEASVARTQLEGWVWAFACRVTLSTSNGRFIVAPADIGLGGASGDYLVYRFCASRPAGRCSAARPTAQVFSATHPFAFAPGGSEADFWIAAPVLPNGWAVLGEAEKLVPVSPQRVESLAFDGGGAGGGAASVTLVLMGSEGEAVTFYFARASTLEVMEGSCTFDKSGRAALVLSDTGGGGRVDNGIGGAPAVDVTCREV